MKLIIPFDQTTHGDNQSASQDASWLIIPLWTLTSNDNAALNTLVESQKKELEKQQTSIQNLKKEIETQKQQAASFKKEMATLKQRLAECRKKTKSPGKPANKSA